MKKHPGFEAERVRLEQRLAASKKQVQSDIADLREALRPINLAKELVSDASEHFRDQMFLHESTRIALAFLPKRFNHPLVGVALQFLGPTLVSNVPKIVDFFRGKKKRKKKVTEDDGVEDLG